MLILSSKLLTILLGTLLIFLQCKIGSANGGLSQVWKLKQSISAVHEQNKALQEKNAILTTDIKDLKYATDAIEEHARMDLGMIRKNEIFYQIVD
jgi:cell division protein FtsB